MAVRSSTRAEDVQRYTQEAREALALFDKLTPSFKSALQGEIAFFDGVNPPTSRFETAMSRMDTVAEHLKLCYLISKKIEKAQQKKPDDPDFVYWNKRKELVAVLLAQARESFGEIAQQKGGSLEGLMNLIMRVMSAASNHVLDKDFRLLMAEKAGAEVEKSNSEEQINYQNPFETL